jgi:diguanylate cyclase (GGDEF)-like protein
MAPLVDQAVTGLQDWMIDAAPCGVLGLPRAEGQIGFVNQTMLDWLELTRAQVVGRLRVQDLLGRVGSIYLQTHVLPMLRLSGGFQEVALPLRSASGIERQTLVAGRMVGDDGQAVLTFSPADGRAHVEEDLARMREAAQTRLTWLRQIERIADIGAWSVDMTTGQATWSDQVFAIHDLPVGTAPSVEEALSFYAAGEQRQTLEAAINRTAETGAPFEFDSVLHTAQRSRNIRVRGAAEWERGKVRRLVGIIQDITEQVRATETLWRAAHVDDLSGLANRAWFGQKLAEAVAEATRSKRGFCLMILDLDHFKDVNDAYGHQTGDAVIRISAERLSACLGPEAFIGRFGGDEFAVIDWDDGTPAYQATHADRLLTALRDRIRVGDAEIEVGVSIGIAQFPQDAASPDALVRSADMALLHAKRTSKGGAAFFNWHIRSAADKRRDAIDRVRQASAAGRIVAHYQPRVHLATGEVRGYEALARIIDADGKVSGPTLWGTALEDPDCARMIDLQVLQAITADWQRLVGAGLGVIGLNTSDHSLKHGDFVSSLLGKLAACGIPPASIEVEVLETVLVGDANPRLGEQLAQLRREGVSVALDDFGTGFASLRHLRDLPIDRIKLDQSFVIGLDDQQSNRAIVQATVDLGHALGIKIVAEGIERPQTRDFLRAIGCDEGQGYLFGRPGPLAP